MRENVELLKYILNDIRRVSLGGIKDLTKEQLFIKPFEDVYPIGAYLMHLAETDISWLEVASGRLQPDELKKRAYFDSWFDSPEGKNNPPKHAPDVDEYLSVMNESRENLNNYLSTLNDSELEEKITLPWRRSVEVTRKWIIYHLIEHEAHTRGQIFLLLRLAGFKKKGENNRV